MLSFGWILLKHNHNGILTCTLKTLSLYPQFSVWLNPTPDFYYLPSSICFEKCRFCCSILIFRRSQWKILGGKSTAQFLHLWVPHSKEFITVRMILNSSNSIQCNLSVVLTFLNTFINFIFKLNLVHRKSGTECLHFQIHASNLNRILRTELLLTTLFWEHKASVRRQLKDPYGVLTKEALDSWSWSLRIPVGSSFFVFWSPYSLFLLLPLSAQFGPKWESLENRRGLMR